VRTTEGYKQRGKPSSERNAQSPAVSHKSLLSKENLQSTMTQKIKTPSNNSGDDGERNPLQGSLENPHKLQVKRKRVNSQQEEEKQNVHEEDIFLDNMDFDVDIENIWFPDDEEHA